MSIDQDASAYGSGFPLAIHIASAALNRELQQDGIEVISPHKQNRIKSKTQDGRPLHRYAKRWRIERLFAWMHNFRRLVV
jgi:IS4 transposase